MVLNELKWWAKDLAYKKKVDRKAKLTEIIFPNSSMNQALDIMPSEIEKDGLPVNSSRYDPKKSYNMAPCLIYMNRDGLGGLNYPIYRISSIEFVGDYTAKIDTLVPNGKRTINVKTKDRELLSKLMNYSEKIDLDRNLAYSQSK